MNKTSRDLKRGLIRKTQEGLTLLEVILAMTILSIIFLGVVSLSNAAVRLTGNFSEEVRLNNELQYVLRDIEINIKPGTNPVVAPPACTPGLPCVQTLTVTDPNGNPITYTYNAAALTLTRTIAGNITILSQGVLVPRLIGLPVLAVFHIPPAAGDIVQINLTAQSIRNNRLIPLPGVTKSILLRGIA